jgi:hypothetical protein
MSRNSKSDDEPFQQHTEDVESNPPKPIITSNHADRAAEMIGAQHIEVTEEDASPLISFSREAFTNVFRTNASVAKPTSTSFPF